MKFQGAMNILIAGGSGMIGTLLKQRLSAEGHKVTILSRTPKGPGFAYWNPSKNEIDPSILAECEVLINLSGEGIANKRWTDSRKELLRTSRTVPAAFLARSLNQMPNKVHTVIQASAIGYYGNSGELLMTEDKPPAEGFLGTTCAMWEAAASAFRTPSRRLVVMRIGIVLANEGGYLAETIKAKRAGMIPVFGDGKQYISWIHIEDIAGFVSHAISKHHITGIYNLAAPSPVTSMEAAVTLKEVTSSAALIMKAPSWLLHLLLGSMASMLTEGQRVSSSRVTASGYSFKFPDIRQALSDLLK